MKYTELSLALLAGTLALGLVNSDCLAQQSAPASFQQTNGHPFACGDYSQGKIFLVGADGKVQWEYPAPSCNELWVLPNGNLLFSTGHGVKEVTRDKKVVFEYQSKSEIYACQRLANGNTFVGECNSGKLLEIEPSGRVAKEIRLLPEFVGFLTKVIQRGNLVPAQGTRAGAPTRVE